MSIFLEIIQLLLVPKIDELHNSSQAADESYLNLGRTLLGYGRNIKVSQSKREQLILFKRSLMDLKDAETVSDQDMLRSIKALTDKCLVNLREARSTELFFPESSTDQIIRSFLSLAEEIYAKLDQIKVLNIKHTEDPLTIFQYHIAYYFAKKIMDCTYPNIVEQIIAHPLVAQTGKLTANKEQFILHHVESVNGENIEGIIPICQKKLNDLQEEHAKLLESRQQIVMTHMTNIQLLNIQFYTRHSSQPLAPPSTSFFDRAYDASVHAHCVGGLLGQCLLAAASEITNYCNTQYEADKDLKISETGVFINTEDCKLPSEDDIDSKMQAVGV